MFDLVFSTFRKATESTLQMPLEFFKTWTQQLLTVQPRVGGTPYEWGRQLQRRSAEMVVETLHQHRASFDAATRAGIQLIGQAFRLSDATSSEEIRRVSEELWHKLVDVLKQQSDAQLRDFQTWAGRSMELQQRSASTALA
ncbi:MAG TPA: hypothetical protein VKZ18_28005 [Polyangia bacterium]|nr:hypothetical protein [Polyangia bacterium]